MARTAMAVCVVLLTGLVAAVVDAAPASRGKVMRTTRRPVTSRGPNPDRWLWEIAAQWPRTGTDESVVDIACSEEAGIAVTNQGRVLISRDGGTHWELCPTAPAPTEDEYAPGFVCCAVAGDRLLAGGYRLIIMSPDAGRTWTTGDIPPVRNEYNNRKWTVRAICPDASDANDIMAVADTPELLRLRNVGTERRWVGNTYEDVPVQEYRTVAMPKAIVFKSADGGFDWSAAIRPGGLELGEVKALHYERTGRSWLVGGFMERALLYAQATGRPYRDVWFSNNDGGTWRPLTTPGALSDAFGGSCKAWIASFGHALWTGCSRQRNPGCLWRSMDAGASWHPMPIPGEFEKAYDMALLSAGKGVMTKRRSVHYRDIYHTMNADEASPKWVKDALPEGWWPSPVAACKAGRYPFVAGAKKYGHIGILGAVPPRRTIVRPQRVRARGPAARRSAPRPR